MVGFATLDMDTEPTQGKNMRLACLARVNRKE